MATIKKMFKQFVSEAKVDDEERTVTAVISTGVVDRDGEVLVPKGMDVEQFLKNPVVQWAHNYSMPPIGTAQWIKKGSKYITAKVKFATKEVSERADEIYQLFKGGFLNAFSVGFISKKSHSPTPDEIKKTPEWAEAWNIIEEWELLEFSAVPVPANPEALATAVKTKSFEISKGLAEELGIEEETVYPTKSADDFETKTDEGIEEVEKQVKEETKPTEIVKLKSIHELKEKKVLKPIIDNGMIKDIAKGVKSTMLGRMF